MKIQKQLPVWLWRTAALCALVAVAYLALTDRSIPVVGRVNDKVNHVAAFACLAFLVDKGFAHQPQRWALAAELMTYGLFIEIMQHFLPYRTASVFDLMADAVGIGVYFLGYSLWQTRAKVAT